MEVSVAATSQSPTHVLSDLDGAEDKMKAAGKVFDREMEALDVSAAGPDDAPSSFVEKGGEPIDMLKMWEKKMHEGPTKKKDIHKGRKALEKVDEQLRAFKSKMLTESAKVEEEEQEFIDKMPKEAKAPKKPAAPSSFVETTAEEDQLAMTGTRLHELQSNLLAEEDQFAKAFHETFPTIGVAQKSSFIETGKKGPQDEDMDSAFTGNSEKMNVDNLDVAGNPVKMNAGDDVLSRFTADEQYRSDHELPKMSDSAKEKSPSGYVAPKETGYDAPKEEPKSTAEDDELSVLSAEAVRIHKIREDMEKKAAAMNADQGGISLLQTQDPAAAMAQLDEHIKRLEKKLGLSSESEPTKDWRTTVQEGENDIDSLTDGLRKTKESLENENKQPSSFIETKPGPLGDEIEKELAKFDQKMKADEKAFDSKMHHSLDTKSSSFAQTSDDPDTDDTDSTDDPTADKPKTKLQKILDENQRLLDKFKNEEANSAAKTTSLEENDSDDASSFAETGATSMSSIIEAQKENQRLVDASNADLAKMDDTVKRQRETLNARLDKLKKQAQDLLEDVPTHPSYLNVAQGKDSDDKIAVSVDAQGSLRTESHP